MVRRLKRVKVSKTKYIQTKFHKFRYNNSVVWRYSYRGVYNKMSFHPSVFMKSSEDIPSTSKQSDLEITGAVEVVEECLSSDKEDNSRPTTPLLD